MNILKKLLLVVAAATLIPFAKAEFASEFYLDGFTAIPPKSSIPNLSIYQLKQNAGDFAITLFNRNKSNYPFFNTESDAALRLFKKTFKDRFGKKFRDAKKFLDLARNNEQKTNDIIRKIAIDSLVIGAKEHLKEKITAERNRIEYLITNFRERRRTLRITLKTDIQTLKASNQGYTYKSNKEKDYKETYDRRIKSYERGLHRNIEWEKSKTRAYKDNIVKPSLAKNKLREFKSSDFGTFLLQKWNVPAVSPDPNNIIFSE